MEKLMLMANLLMPAWVESLRKVKHLLAPDSHFWEAGKALSDPRWISRQSGVCIRKSALSAS